MENRNRLRVKTIKKLRTKFYLAAVFVVSTFVATTGGAIVEAYRKVASENVIPAVSSAWLHVYGIFNPLPEHYDYHFSVTFFNPPFEGNPVSSESTGVSITGEDCRKSGGKTSYMTSSSNMEGWQNYVITEAFCSSHGVTVTLIPQAGGEKQIIYEGLFYEGKQIAFPGVSGRYNAGVLTLLSTDRSEPHGEWVPANECQKGGAC